MKVYGVFVQVTQSGERYGVVGVCTERKAVTEFTQTSDEPNNEQVLREYVQVEHQRTFYELECEDGDLTYAGVEQFEQFLDVVKSSMVADKLPQVQS